LNPKPTTHIPDKRYLKQDERYADQGVRADMRDKEDGKFVSIYRAKGLARSTRFAHEAGLEKQEIKDDDDSLV
jgi:hypothetical protein